MESTDRWRLGIVEQSPVRQGGSGAEALRETLALAVEAESLGYERFWVAEHHNMPSIASTSPEVLIGEISARTSRIRVGSGGVMLPHYSAYKVAENFRMLEILHPGRIDLGLGRAPGGDQRTAAALAYPRSPIDVRAYPEQVDDLIGFLGDDLPPDHPFSSLRAGPPAEGVPEVWLLGSGVDSAQLAAVRGLPFSFAHFFGSGARQGPEIVEHYRRNFRPSARFPEPRVHVAIQVLCAETKEEAEWHSSSLRLSQINMARGRATGIVSPREAAEHDFSPEELAFLARGGMRAVVGDPATVRAEIESLAERYGTRELGIVTICFDFEARRRSFQLVARECNLGPGKDAETAGTHRD